MRACGCGRNRLLRPDDPRFRAMVAAIERNLRRGDFLLRYDTDAFGVPDAAFLVCTFWWIQVLALLGERDRASSEQNTASPVKRGTHIHTMLARVSTSAPMRELPMTARSRLRLVASLMRSTRAPAYRPDR